MIKLTILKNPFNATDRSFYQCDFIPDKTIYQYAQPYLMGMKLDEEEEIAYSVDGSVIKDLDFIPSADSHIVACPVIGKKGKNIFASIAMIALAVVAPGVGQGLAGASVKLPSALGSFYTAGIMMIGGLLINHIFPVDSDSDTTSSTSQYSWTTPSTLTNQGNALAVTYGTARTSGQLLSSHVTVSGDDQYLNLLLCGGEGEIDSIDDIIVDSNAIANYTGVTIEKRFGTNDQDIISNFKDEFVDLTLDIELMTPYNFTSYKWVTRSIDTNAAQGLEITVELPYGLYRVKDDGNNTSTYVHIIAQYSLEGSGTWTTFANTSISATSTDAIRRVYRKDNIPIGNYKVRVCCSEKDGIKSDDSIDSRYVNRVYWTQLSGIVYDDFIHPNKVLLGIKALATNQLSGGLPDISWKQTRNNVWVYDNDPESTTYQSYVQKPANNPAWACYDMIHGCRKLMNIQTGIYEYTVFGVAHTRIDYLKFEEWAAICTAKGYAFNAIIDSADSLWNVLKYPCAVGFGTVLMRGTKYSCVFDCEKEVVQLFNVSNMLDSNFKEEYVSMNDRANAVEVTYINADNGDEKEVISVYADDWDELEIIPNSVQTNLIGCTNTTQAYQYGKQLLRNNKYLNRTVSWDADIDAIACQVGDLVNIQHDVPMWGNYGGRIVETYSDKILVLDRKVSLSPSTVYMIHIQLDDNTYEERQLVNNLASTFITPAQYSDAPFDEPVEVSVVEVSTAFTSTINEGCLYAIGEVGKVVKPFTITKMTRAGELTKKFTAIEYIPEVFTTDDDITVINYSALSTTIPEVSNIRVSQDTYKESDGTITSTVYCSWDINRSYYASAYRVSYSTDNINFIYFGESHSSKIAITGLNSLKTYYIKIQSMNSLGMLSTGVTSAGIYITGKSLPPSDVTFFTYSTDPLDKTKIVMEWTEVADLDLKGYEIRKGNTWDAGTPIAGTIYGDTYVYQAVEEDADQTLYFWIKSIDRTGNYSDNALSITVSISVRPASVQDFNIVQNGNELIIYWTKNTETDIIGYEMRQGATWDSGAIIFTNYTELRYEMTIATETTMRFHIKAINRAGFYSLLPTTFSITPTNIETLNIILSYDELDRQDGTSSNVEFGESSYNCLNMPGTCDQYDGDPYPLLHCNDVGAINCLKLTNTGGVYTTSGVYLCARKDMGMIITAGVAMTIGSNVLLSSKISYTLEYRTSLNNITFTEWKPYMYTTMQFRYLDVRITLNTTDTTISPEISGFDIAIDVPEVEYSGTTVIAVGGTDVSYGHTFYSSAPVFIPMAVGEYLQAKIVSLGSSSAKVKIINLSNTDVGGTIIWRVKGF